MSYEISIEYSVFSDNQTRTLYLEPDQAISYQFGGTFNWIGSILIGGERVEIKIPQEKISDEPIEKDIVIDKRVFINKKLLIWKIKEKLNTKMN